LVRRGVLKDTYTPHPVRLLAKKSRIIHVVRKVACTTDRLVFISIFCKLASFPERISIRSLHWKDHQK
jgi:hypothetical protein